MTLNEEVLKTLECVLADPYSDGKLYAEPLLRWVDPIKTLEEENKRLKVEALSVAINDLPEKDRKYEELKQERDQLREALNKISAVRHKHHKTINDYMNSVELMAAIADVAIQGG